MVTQATGVAQVQLTDPDKASLQAIHQAAHRYRERLIQQYRADTAGLFQQSAQARKLGSRIFADRLYERAALRVAGLDKVLAGVLPPNCRPRGGAFGAVPWAAPEPDERLQQAYGRACES